VLNEEDVRRLYSYKDFAGFMLALSQSPTARPGGLRTHYLRLMQKLRQQSSACQVYVSIGVIRARQPVEPIFEGMERGRERGQRDFAFSLLWT